MDITSKLIYRALYIVMFFASASTNAATVWQSDMKSGSWTLYLVTEDSDPTDLDLGNVTGMYFDSHVNGQIDPISLINSPPSSLLIDDYDIASTTGAAIAMTIFPNAALPPNSFQINLLTSDSTFIQPISGTTTFSVNCSTANNACLFSSPFPLDPGGGFANVLTFDGSVVAPILTTVIPVPPAVWLFGSGLLGLIGIARRKAA
jgi:prepilin-type processing-associated H-X9-DG protein